MPAFDRGMVTAVLWLTLLLVWRRRQAEIALAQKAAALRDAVQELRRSNADLEDFSSVVSHDVRGPLYSISMAAKIISSRSAGESGADSRKLLDSIAAEISRVCCLIESLSDYGSHRSRQSEAVGLQRRVGPG